MMSLMSAAVGVAAWSATEWTVHNLLGHKFAKNRNFFAVEHVRHHRTTSYFAPDIKKAAAAAIVTAAVGPVAIVLAGKKIGLSFTAGLVGTYIGYEVLHRFAHTRAPRTRYGRWLRKHHFHHHFHAPNMNHGVTSPIWDMLLGSYETPQTIEVPVRHAMPWLIDEDGQVRAEFRDDYALIDKSKRKARVQRYADDDAGSGIRRRATAVAARV